MLYLFGAKKMQTSAKKACFQFAECSFSSAKKMQTSAKKACFQFAECSFSSAKKMQTSAKKACFQFAECSFSSAKIRLFLVTSKFLGKNIARVVKKKTGDSGMESRLLNIVVSMMKQRIIY